jgi:hypothetical protein
MQSQGGKVFWMMHCFSFFAKRFFSSFLTNYLVFVLFLIILIFCLFLDVSIGYQISQEGLFQVLRRVCLIL